MVGTVATLPDTCKLPPRTGLADTVFLGSEILPLSDGSQNVSLLLIAFSTIPLSQASASLQVLLLFHLTVVIANLHTVMNFHARFESFFLWLSFFFFPIDLLIFYNQNSNLLV